jgi:DNA-binding response OmpR family regulator
MAPLRPSRASILVIDDDPAVTRTLMDALELGDYRVWHAINGVEARGQMQRAGLNPDLILLDLMLPDIDGLVLCSLLKSVSDVPIIICTGSSRRADPVLALKLGADDFVRKPFDVDDLLARVEAVLRRAPPRPDHGLPPPRPTQLRVGALVVEPARRRALLGGEALPLTPTEFRLLTVLVAQPDEILSREYLAVEVWGYADVSNGRTIDVHVRRLRLKLGGCAVPGPTIISVRGMGYRIAASDTAITAA